MPERSPDAPAPADVRCSSDQQVAPHGEHDQHHQHMTVSGVVSGVTMVFVPSISTFYISQKLGAGKIDLVGDTIERLFQNTSTYGVGATMSLIMMVLIIVSVCVMNRFTDNEEGGMVI